jgi:dTMP kinase
MAQIVCFEGIDGSGKTMQIELLRAFLEKKEKRACALSYPVYSSFFGLELGHILSGRHVSASLLDPKSMALWYALDRWLDYRERKNLFTEPDAFVLLNRYTLSSMVYQAVRSDDPEGVSAWVEQLEHEILGLPRPDLYVILDLPTKAGRTNIGKKGLRDYVGAVADIYEQDSSLHERCRFLYRNLADKREDIVVVPCAEHGEMRHAEAIAADVFQCLMKRGLLIDAV